MFKKKGRVIGDDAVHAESDEALIVCHGVGGPRNHAHVHLMESFDIGFGDPTVVAGIDAGAYCSRYGDRVLHTVRYQDDPLDFWRASGEQGERSIVK